MADRHAGDGGGETTRHLDSAAGRPADLRSVDGVAGPATMKLIHAQAGYGWNLVAARKAFVKGTAGA